MLTAPGCQGNALGPCLLLTGAIGLHWPASATPEAGPERAPNPKRGWAFSLGKGCQKLHNGRQSGKSGGGRA